jgi:hypothetical protein
LGEPGAIEKQLGDPNANTPKGVAHTKLDPIPGEDINTNVNVPMHLEGMGPETWLKEGEIARGNIGVEGDGDPHIELQGPGVSHLATPGDDMFLTSSPSPPNTLETARMQWTPAITEPADLCGMDSEPQPLNMPPPNEGMEPAIHHLPEQVQAPTDVSELLESPWIETAVYDGPEEPDASMCTRGQDAHKRGAWMVF